MKKGEIEREVSDLLAHFPNALQQLGYKDEEDIAFVLSGLWPGSEGSCMETALEVGWVCEGAENMSECCGANAHILWCLAHVLAALHFYPASCLPPMHLPAPGRQHLMAQYLAFCHSDGRPRWHS